MLQGATSDKIKINEKVQEDLLRKLLKFPRNAYHSSLSKEDTNKFFELFPEEQRTSVFENLKILARHGLIDLGKPTSGNHYFYVYAIQITEDGLNYFDHKLRLKQDSRRNFWKNFFSQFLTGFISGVLVALVAAYLLFKLGLQ